MFNGLGGSIDKIQNAISILLARQNKLVNAMEEKAKEPNQDLTTEAPKDTKEAITSQFIQEKFPLVTKDMFTHGKETDPIKPPSLLVAKAGNKFSKTLYEQLRKMESTNNLVVSPFSLASALAMLTPGARGLTLSQVATICTLGS